MPAKLIGALDSPSDIDHITIFRWKAEPVDADPKSPHTYVLLLANNNPENPHIVYITSKTQFTVTTRDFPSHYAYFEALGYPHDAEATDITDAMSRLSISRESVVRAQGLEAIHDVLSRMFYDPPAKPSSSWRDSFSQYFSKERLKPLLLETPNPAVESGILPHKVYNAILTHMGLYLQYDLTAPLSTPGLESKVQDYTVAHFGTSKIRGEHTKQRARLAEPPLGRSYHSYTETEGGSKKLSIKIDSAFTLHLKCINGAPDSADGRGAKLIITSEGHPSIHCAETKALQQILREATKNEHLLLTKGPHTLTRCKEIDFILRKLFYSPHQFLDFANYSAVRTFYGFISMVDLRFITKSAKHARNLRRWIELNSSSYADEMVPAEEGAWRSAQKYIGLCRPYLVREQWTLQERFIPRDKDMRPEDECREFDDGTRQGNFKPLPRSKKRS